MGHDDRTCRKCKRQGLEKALNIIIGAAASRLDDEELDCHQMIAIIAERINQEILNSLDVQ